MPSKTLESSTQLLLPQVQLQLTEDLTGKPASGAAVNVPDDPANPAKSQLHWTSEQQMEFTVTPDLVPPGLYDVVVTNPDLREVRVGSVRRDRGRAFVGEECDRTPALRYRRDPPEGAACPKKTVVALMAMPDRNGFCARGRGLPPAMGI
jgi:hypothetical protein